MTAAKHRLHEIIFTHFFDFLHKRPIKLLLGIR